MPLRNNHPEGSLAGPSPELEEETPQMYQAVLQLLAGTAISTTRDGRPVATGQPEPEFLRRRYEHAQALREIEREAKVRVALEKESRGFVERIRTRLGIA